MYEREFIIRDGNRIRINGNGTFNKADLKWGIICNKLGYFFQAFKGNNIIVEKSSKEIEEISRYLLEKEYRKNLIKEDDRNDSIKNESKFYKHLIDKNFNIIEEERIRKNGENFKSDIRDNICLNNLSKELGHENGFKLMGPIMTDSGGRRTLVKLGNTEILVSFSPKAFKEIKESTLGKKGTGSPAQNAIIEALKRRKILFIREACIEYIPSLSKIIKDLNKEKLRSLYNISRAQNDFIILNHLTGKVYNVQLISSGHNDKYDDEIIKNKDIFNYLNIEYIPIYHDTKTFEKGSYEENELINEVLEKINLSNVQTDESVDINYFENIYKGLYNTYINEGNSHKEAFIKVKEVYKKSFENFQKNINN